MGGGSKSQGFKLSMLVPNFFVQKLKDRKARRRQTLPVGESTSFECSNQSRDVLLVTAYPQQRQQTHHLALGSSPAHKTGEWSFQSDSPVKPRPSINEDQQLVVEHSGRGLLTAAVVRNEKATNPIFKGCLLRSRCRSFSYSVTLSDSDSDTTGATKGWKGHRHRNSADAIPSVREDDCVDQESKHRDFLPVGRVRERRKRRSQSFSSTAVQTIRCIESTSPPRAPASEERESASQRSLFPQGASVEASPAYLSRRLSFLEQDVTFASFSSDEGTCINSGVQPHRKQDLKWESCKSSPLSEAGHDRNLQTVPFTKSKNEGSRLYELKRMKDTKSRLRESEPHSKENDPHNRGYPNGDAEGLLYGGVGFHKNSDMHRNATVGGRKSFEAPRMSFGSPRKSFESPRPSFEVLMEMADGHSKGYDQAIISSRPQHREMNQKDYETAVFGGPCDKVAGPVSHPLDSRMLHISERQNHVGGLDNCASVLKTRLGYASLPLHYYVKRDANAESPVYEELGVSAGCGCDHHERLKSEESDLYPYTKIWDSEFPSFRSESINAATPRRAVTEKGCARVDNSESECYTPRSRLSRNSRSSRTSCDGTDRDDHRLAEVVGRICQAERKAEEFDRKMSYTRSRLEYELEAGRNAKTKPVHHASLQGSDHGLKANDIEAVVKASYDPYMDFRESMVEMIIERGIEEPEELEDLLQCYLSLNSAENHSLIVKVFSDLWQSIFEETKQSLLQ